MSSTQGGSDKAIALWSKDALLSKAHRYSQEMLAHDRSDWRFGLSSTFALEFLARACLASVSPVLLADAKDVNNLYFALGIPPKAAKFIPRAVDLRTVAARLRELLPGFTPDHEGFMLQHANRRNEELHTGAIPFDGLASTWLPNFYQCCDVLLGSLGETTADLFGEVKPNWQGR